MKAPDTIYIPDHFSKGYNLLSWSMERCYDTDLAYVRADLSAYELGKIIEAQKAEIARLRQLLTVHGRHTYACKKKYGPRHDCTCGFTAALKGE